MVSKQVKIASLRRNENNIKNGSQAIIESYIQSKMIRERNSSPSYVRITKSLLNRLCENHDLKTVTQEDIAQLLNKVRKPESEDPLHKWIGTYNFYISILKKFFKWYDAPYCMQGFKELRRKEVSIYKPTDIWTTEDDLLFLKYCPSVRDRAYHAISRDLSCRPSEILRIRIKDVVFKMAQDKQYAEILVNGKTGSRHIPLINSIPYLKDWLDVHPSRNNPNAYLIRSHRTRDKMTSGGLLVIYKRYKNDYFPKLLETDIPVEDKQLLQELLQKPWNPYIRRHSALTEKSKILKEHILRSHAGWQMSSKMPQKYLHYFGNESSESLLEAYGLKPKSEDINKLQPIVCPNCAEPNKIDAKFCFKCRMVLSYSAYLETKEEKEKESMALNSAVERLTERISQLEQKLTWANYSGGVSS